jgi:hypothetical protein
MGVFDSRHAKLLAACAAAAMAAVLAPIPAQAQVVCGVSATGAEDQSGAGATATGSNALACGPNATAGGADSTAVGSLSLATGAGASAVGVNSQAVGPNSIAIGTNALSAGESTIAIGANSVAADSIAIGAGALAAGGGTAVGDGSVASFTSGVGGAAFGQGAIADNVNLGTAIGFQSVVTTDNSVALGANSVANRGALSNYRAVGVAGAQNSVGEVSVGSVGAERQITNVAAGSLGTDAVNVNQLVGAVNRLNDDLSRGIAVAIAMEDPDLAGDDNFGVRLNWGNWEGENALGVSAAANFGDAFWEGASFGASAALGFTLDDDDDNGDIFFNNDDDDDEIGARVGVQLTWGGFEK